MHTQATIYIRILNLRNVKNHYKYYKFFPPRCKIPPKRAFKYRK